MAKRIVTRIGNVFCAEINGEFKRFFQYVANDLTQLNSSVIRIFKTHYPMDYKPVIEDIIKDEVEFYAHTILKAGILFNAWYKVGTSKEVGEVYKNALFGYAHEHRYPTVHDITEVNPIENWDIWTVNQPYQIRRGRITKDISENLSPGGVIPYIDIVHKMQYGYYRYKTAGWTVIDNKDVALYK